MLLERDALLTALRELADDALSSQGHLVLLGGEAGVGKTSLVAGLVRQLTDTASTLVVRHGACDDLTTAAALGPVMDAVPEIGGLVEGPGAVAGVRLFRAVRDVLIAAPTVLVLDDVHWADQATLDLLRFLARRLDGAPLLVVATYRSETVTSGHPLAAALGDLATTPAVRRMAVPSLSVAAVRRLAESSGSQLDAGALFETTGGNAFYVTEVLASGDPRLPASVRDAVLARVARLSPDARHVLAAGAVLGQPADLALLERVSGRPRSAVDECVAAGLLVGAGTTWEFRHALARLAVADTLPPSVRADLHARALEALQDTGEGGDDRRLALHAAGCGDRPALLRHGPQAAARASRLGAHRQSAELYRLCLSAGPVERQLRHELFSLLSYECYLTGELEEAHVARREALELAESAAQRGQAQRWLSRLSWFLARKEEADRYAEQAVRTLEEIEPGPELAMAYSNKAQLAMLAFDVTDAVDWGTRAIDLARRVGDREVEIHALNNVGAALALVGDYLEGTARLEQSLDLALAADAHEHVARAYTNLASSAVSVRRFGDAERFLRAGTAYCIERDLDSWQNYMDAWRARSLAEQGRYETASEVAARLLARPHLPVVTRIPALAVTAQVVIRRGQDADALLAEAAGLAEGTHEAQRLVPVAVARAESAWLHGRVEDIDAAVDLAWATAARHPQEWELGELAWWSWVAGTSRDTAVPVAAPFRMMLDGAWSEAAAAWSVIGCPLWQALSLSRVPDLEAARQGLSLLDSIGAPAVRAAVVRDRLTAGLPVPRGPRETSRSNVAGLTARELDVLALLVDGLSNAAIAEALVLSHKTVGHHVSAVLTKLGEPSRSRAAAAAVRRGIVPATTATEG